MGLTDRRKTAKNSGFDISLQNFKRESQWG